MYDETFIIYKSNKSMKNLIELLFAFCNQYDICTLNTLNYFSSFFGCSSDFGGSSVSESLKSPEQHPGHPQWKHLRSF